MPFRPNIFELSHEKFLQACDIFRFLISLYLLFIVYQKGKDAFGKRGLRIQEGITMVLDLAIVGLYMTAWIISYYFSRENTADLI
jgi:hypothetical protein